IARGEYTVVLGELHSAMHSYLRPLCIEDVPHRDRLIAAYEADIERGCVFPVTSRSAATAMDDASMSRADYELVSGDTPPAPGPAPCAGSASRTGPTASASSRRTRRTSSAAASSR